MSQNPNEKLYESFTGLTLFNKNDNGKTSTLGFGLVDHRPRMTGFIKSGDKLEVINIKLTYVALLSLLGLLKKMAKSDDLKEEYVFTSFDIVYEDGKRTDEIAPIGNLKIHRDAIGTIYLTLFTTTELEYSFKLTLDELWHKVRKGDIPVTTSKTMSDMITLEYAEMLGSLYSKSIYDNRYQVKR